MSFPTAHSYYSSFLFFGTNCRKKNRCLKARECKVFKENLLYYFYGKPSYRVETEYDRAGNINYAPVCFILRPDSVKKIKRIYPFDSGAYKAGMFNRYIHHKMDIDSFSLGNSIENASKAIAAFFGNNRNYYFNKISPAANIDPNNRYADSYLQIQLNKDFSIDDRKGSIEVQVSEDTRLRTNIIAMALPYQFLQDNDIVETLNRWNATPIPYHTFDDSNPSKFSEVIREKLVYFLDDKGYL